MLLPSLIRPMLAVDHPYAFDSFEYCFEVKWDGYRAIAYCEGEVKLLSRNDKQLTHRFPELAQDLKQIIKSCILDGELVVLGDDSKPSFSRLQSGSFDDQAIYLVFDLLYLDSESLLDLPWVERRGKLEELLINYSLEKVVISQVIEKQGTKFYEGIITQGLEGMVAKRKDSIYTPGRRSNAWLKIKERYETDAVIIGFIPTLKDFQSLVLAQQDSEGNYVYIGNVGTGFSIKDKEVLLAGLNRILSDSVLLAKPPMLENVIWVKPLLVATVAYLEYTDEGRLRQPSFLRLRSDKAPSECGLP